VSEEDHWELHEQLADALAADAAEANVLSQQLGLPEDEASDVAAALAALGAATAFDDPDPLLASLLGSGEKIGDYEVLERVGRGGFGVVYRARDPVLNVDVALKLIPVSPGVEDEVQERFAQEARAVARLDHPNIVRVRTAGWDPRGPFLVMDFAPGESLQHRLEREGPLPPVEAVAIARQLAEALDHAHEHGVVHRDVKPDNVIVTPDGLARLTDFGLARDALAHGDSKVSRAGHALGTPGYWPPEQARGDLDAIGPASDVYGLGATLYALLTGRPPYTGPHTLAILEAMARRAEVPPPSAERAEVGSYQDAVCARCLEHDPQRRYPSARALADALAAWGTDAAERTPKTGGAVFAIVAAVVVLFALAAFVTGDDRDSPAPEAVVPVVPVDPVDVAPIPSQVVADPKSTPVGGHEATPWWDRQPDWRQVHVTAAPKTRAEATLVSDPLGQRVFMFGGSTRKTASSELWSWDGRAWRESLARGPAPSGRTGSAGIFDPRRRRLVIFGGRDEDGWQDDLWEWDGERWSQGSLPSAARSVSKPVAAQDLRRGVSVVLLGREIWEWSGGWSLRPSPPVTGRQLIWFQARERILLFGQDGRLWDYDGAAWNGASSPLPRTKLRFMWAVAAGDDAVLALVGSKPPKKRSAVLETWLYTSDTWRKVDAKSPAMRSLAGMAWLPARKHALLFGGERRRRAQGTTWLLSPTR
jgi:hypothetical protein